MRIFSNPHASKRIWLIGGTQESAQLAIALIQAQISCVVTVTSDSARLLYPDHPLLAIWVGRLDAVSLPAFCQTYAVAAILDASHPFAVEISQLAIQQAPTLTIPYLRFERSAMATEVDSQNIHYLNSFETLVKGDYLSGQRALLIVGYRPLHWFRPWQAQANLFARILPSIQALEAALAAGFTGDRLLALRPPVTADLERALWQQWQITTVITKASGTPGGEDIKRQIAAELGVTLLIISRPEMAYPNQTREVTVALDFCQKSLHP